LDEEQDERGMSAAAKALKNTFLRALSGEKFPGRGGVDYADLAFKAFNNLLYERGHAVVRVAGTVPDYKYEVRFRDVESASEWADDVLEAGLVFDLRRYGKTILFNPRMTMSGGEYGAARLVDKARKLGGRISGRR
jgi:hypothetical protein